MVATIDGGLHRWPEGGDRQSSRQLWQQLYDTTDDTWSPDNAQLKLRTAHRARRHPTRWPLLVRRFKRGQRAAPGRGTNWSRCGCSQASRWDPSGTPYELSPDARRGRVVRAVVTLAAAAPVPEEDRPDIMTTAWLVALFGLLGLAVRELPERLHPPPAPRSVAGLPGVTLHELPPQAELVRERAGAGMARPAGTVSDVPRGISPVYPRVELFTGVMFAWAAWHYGPGWLLISRLLFGCMLIVLFFIDLRPPDPAQRHHGGRYVIGFILSFVTPPDGCRRSSAS